MINNLRSPVRFFKNSLARLFLLLTVFVLFSNQTVIAMTWKDLRSTLNATEHYKEDDCGGDSGSSGSTSAGGPLKSGDKVYIIGDSITHGATAKYKELFGAKQITPTISAEDSRSWNGAGNGSHDPDSTPGPAKDAIVTDSAKVKEAKAVIVALGTNGFEGANPIDEIVSKVKELNGSAQMYWVNVMRTDNAEGSKSFNSALAGKTDKFKVIDWAKTLEDGGGASKLLRDNAHPNSDGYQKLGELVVNTTTSGSSTPPAGTTTTTPPATQGAKTTKGGHVLPATTDAPSNPDATKPADQKKPGELSLRDQIAQMMFVRVDSEAEANDAVEKHHVGGFYVSDTFLDGAKIQAAKGKNTIAPFVGIDQEGGKIDRMKVMPDSAKVMGGKGTEEVKKIGSESAAKMKAIGVSVDFAPVVDIDNPSSEAIGQLGRAFSDNTDTITEKAGAFAEGLKAGGVIPTYKHFPGIGNTLKNSDFAAESTPPIDQLKAKDLKPYEKLLSSNTSGAWVMMSNYTIPGLTSGPATIDKAAYDLLKNDYKFNGIIVTDDLKAKGLTGSLPDIVLASIKAGADVALFTGEPELKTIIDKVEQAANADPALKTQIETSSAKILAAKKGDQPKTAAGGCCSTSSSSGGSTNAPNGNQEENARTVFTFLVGKGLSGEQAAGVLGNMEGESGFEPQRAQGIFDRLVPAENWSQAQGGGYGLVQWTPGSKMVDAVKAAGKDPNQIGAQLDFLWQQLESTEKAAGDALKAATTIEEATIAFETKYERHAAPPIQPERQEKAKKWFEKFKGLAGTTSSSSSGSSCGSSGAAGEANGADAGSGIVQGDHIKTAIGLAWPIRKEPDGQFVKKEDATPAYQAALPKFNGATDANAYTNCSIFVATVMRASGVDPNYPLRNTWDQLPYLRAHPEKYTVIDNITSAEQLQPGDIIINQDHHTMIFVGKQSPDDQYDTRDASLNDRVPGAKVFAPHPSGQTYSAARLKK